LIILVVGETLNLRVCLQGLWFHKHLLTKTGYKNNVWITQASNSASLKVLRIVTILVAIATKKASIAGAMDNNCNVDVSGGFHSQLW